MELVILHVSDVHVARDKIQQLKEWLKVHNQRVDVVLVSGDIANMSMDPQASQEEVAMHHRNMDAMVKAIAQINPNLYYIPGNHDAITTFNTSHLPLDAPPTNVHMKKVQLAPHLHLAGLGGSLPGYLNGNHHWSGFPYQSHAEIGQDLHKLLDPIFFSEESSLPPGDTMILMTHCGPSESATTKAYSDVGKALLFPPIESGSSVLSELLCKQELQDHVLMNIHGHTHVSFGHVHLGRISVLNSGALVEGRFAIYHLIYKGGSQGWELKAFQFYQLA